MKKAIVVLALPLLVGGCALPMSVRIATWAVDGISYLATEKSLSDHMLSAVTEQDCAVWRGIKGDDICIDTSDEIQVAAVEVAKATGEQPPVGAVSAMTETPVAEADEQDAGEDLATFVTAAGPVQKNEETARQYSATETLLAGLPLPKSKPVAPVSEQTLIAKADRLPVHETDEPPLRLVNSELVYVIGSYGTMEEAASKSLKLAGLRPVVVHRPMDGGMVYRLVVGFSEADQKRVRSRIVKAGVRNLWAARFEQEAWPVVSETELAKAAGAEVADVRIQ
ncbi:SPOR domain-containing protein [Magnetospira sp. QH-2]|uniref:SPOR domain-containing protein n=1 Tax=Magnetospira sp. (strain QH-2) TaxID=1288970 RepID=UPI0003E819A8|nr:hypothetical protein [Magnetospira sp. QH-2]CCQ74159.1 Exported protein of unknown function [Magnetospira sp. QH-2]